MAVWDTAKAETIKTSMESTLDGMSIDEVRAEGMTIRIGGRVVKLQVSEEVSLPEDEIRAEYARRLTEKLQAIKGVLNEKMSEMSYMVEQSRQDFEEKERKLQERLATANLMPDITYEQAKQGLSVVKGGPGGTREADKLTWLYQGVYWPKTFNGRPLDPRYTKKLISPVTIEIVTVGRRVSSVTVRKTIGLGKFSHYHQTGSGDCWGQWNYPREWSTPDDILNIGRRAIAVLENVNGGSLGNRTPEGLPRAATLESKIVSMEEARQYGFEATRGDERSGVTTGAGEQRGDTQAIWST